MLALFSCTKEVSITPYLSKDQIAAAREMDLLTYLRRFEPEELVHIGGDTYATRTHDSLKISNGKWCWWSRGIGGTNALDYCRKKRERPRSVREQLQGARDWCESVYGTGCGES